MLQVQKLSLLEVERINDRQFNRIDRSFHATPLSKNEVRYQTAKQVHALVLTFSIRCEAEWQKVKRTRPDAATGLMADDYARVCDSLKMIFQQHSATQAWLYSCPFIDNGNPIRAQLNNWLLNGDSGEVHILLQNLRLKANLALSRLLEILGIGGQFPRDPRFVALKNLLDVLHFPRLTCIRAG